MHFGRGTTGNTNSFAIGKHVEKYSVWKSAKQLKHVKLMCVLNANTNTVVKCTWVYGSTKLKMQNGRMDNEQKWRSSHRWRRWREGAVNRLNVDKNQTASLRISPSSGHRGCTVHWSILSIYIQSVESRAWNLTYFGRLTDGSIMAIKPNPGCIAAPYVLQSRRKGWLLRG